MLLRVALFVQYRPEMSITCSHPSQDAWENPHCPGCIKVLRWLAAGSEPHPVAQYPGSVAPVAVAREWLAFARHGSPCPLTEGDAVLVADFLSMSVMDLSREVSSLKLQILELSRLGNSGSTPPTRNV